MTIPVPKFKIGQIVRLSDNDDLDEVGVIVGMRLRYYRHMRMHVWYYELADSMSCPPVTNDWLSVEDIEAATAETDNQKWRIDGGEVPMREMIVCWNCEQYRVDDEYDCPYCSADYEPDNGTDAAAIAVEMAQSLGLDAAIRTIAKSGRNYDHGPNWYAEWEGMQISATFGAGTNSAWCQTLIDGETTVLYAATEYGRHIKTFRSGPWVQRVLNWSSIVQADNEAEANKRKAEQSAQTALDFKEVDF